MNRNKHKLQRIQKQWMSFFFVFDRHQWVDRTDRMNNTSLKGREKDDFRENVMCMYTSLVCGLDQWMRVDEKAMSLTSTEFLYIFPASLSSFAPTWLSANKPARQEEPV